MPTYSYRCTACDHAFDVQQSMSDASLEACPSCNGKLRKLFSAVGVTFNGSGFYRTDSRSGGASSSGGSSSSGSSSTGSNAPSNSPSSTPSSSSSGSSSGSSSA